MLNSKPITTKCGICGAFISLRNRWNKETSSWPLIWCRRCNTTLNIPLQLILKRLL